jgi:hypothetical protein
MHAPPSLLSSLATHGRATLREIGGACLDHPLAGGPHRHKGRIDMASSGKRKTTMAKLARESRLRERRVEKKARKDARRYAAEHPQPEREHDDPSDESLEEPGPAPSSGASPAAS